MVLKNEVEIDSCPATSQNEESSRPRLKVKDLVKFWDEELEKIKDQNHQKIRIR